MKYKLINEYPNNTSTIEVIMNNRGIKKENIEHYLNTTEKDICDYKLLGEEYLKQGLIAILQAVKENQNALLITDADCDGYTSAALLYNYLYLIFPNWTENNIEIFLHSGKQHGLSDVSIEQLKEKDIKLVFCPDSASNDYTYHQELKKLGITVLVLDHHLCDKRSEDAIIINNQISDYPNKFLSGVGVTWQFCRYIDDTLGFSFANDFLGLVATGLAGDMMDVREYETRYLINEGICQYDSPHNKFLFSLRLKNNFSIGNVLTCDGLQWYIVPYINAMVRSGKQDEKRILFLSMLDNYCEKKVPSTKRGHKDGDEETILVQALRIVNSVKDRQKKLETAGMKTLEKIIQRNNMLQEPVLLFTLDDSVSIDNNIKGLVANKLMSKYQRPVIVSSKLENDNTVYSGSARNYGRSPIANFKTLLNSSGYMLFAEGHEGAMGCAFKEENIENLKQFFRLTYKDVSTEPVYYVDFLFEDKVSDYTITEIAYLKYLWGQEFSEPLILIKDIPLTEDNVFILSRDKNPTLKIELSNHVEVMKFKLTEEEIEIFDNLKKQKLMTVVGTCSINNWNGNETPQIIIKDYEIINTNKYIF